MLVPFASALGSNVDKLGLSYSTIRRQRCKHREEKAAEIRVILSNDSFDSPLGWEIDALTD